MLVRTPDEQSLFQETCTIAVECGHFKMSWIGLIDRKSNHKACNDSRRR
jgi:hypothetical protein